MMKLKMLQQEGITRHGSIKIIYKGPKDFKILCPYFVKSGYKKKKRTNQHVRNSMGKWL